MKLYVKRKRRAKGKERRGKNSGIKYEEFLAPFLYSIT